jgi:hypothetical protein
MFSPLRFAAIFETVADRIAPAFLLTLGLVAAVGNAVLLLP